MLCIMHVDGTRSLEAREVDYSCSVSACSVLCTNYTLEQQCCAEQSLCESVYRMTLAPFLIPFDQQWVPHP